MATTTKVTLSMNSVAYSLAQEAAARTKSSVSGVVSGTVLRHLLADFAPPVVDSPDALAAEIAAAKADEDLTETAARYDNNQEGTGRAAG